MRELLQRPPLLPAARLTVLSKRGADRALHVLIGEVMACHRSPDAALSAARLNACHASAGMAEPAISSQWALGA